MATSVITPPTIVPALAASEPDRTLWLHHTHTGQTQKFTYKRNGAYDSGVLRQMNVFLADWRTKEPTKMDPALFDLLWEVYQDVGANQPYNIVSSYRSPKTNSMLRAKSSGVAENSQHMRGKAMDVFIPGVNLSKLRESAMRHQVGGVGYYPTSGSPFVHMDTGNVRAWPRMTRTQLAKVFPDGKTLHIPVDGKPLSDKGRTYAMAEWNKCHSVPCNGRPAAPIDDGVRVAEAAPPAGKPAGDIPIPAPRLNRNAAGVQMQLAALDSPAQRMVPTVSVDAPIPVRKPQRLVVATRAAAPTDAGTSRASGGQTALAALTSLDTGMPRPRQLLSGTADQVLAAYAPDAGAQLALRSIIDNSTTGALPPLKKPLGIQGRPATGAAPAAPVMGDMFAGTFEAVDASMNDDLARALNGISADNVMNLAFEMRDTELVAPELDHVNDTFVEPQPMTASFWADMTEAEGYIEKGTELGPLTARFGFVPEGTEIPAYDRFVDTAPQLVAAL